MPKATTPLQRASARDRQAPEPRDRAMTTMAHGVDPSERAQRRPESGRPALTPTLRASRGRAGARGHTARAAGHGAPGFSPIRQLPPSTSRSTARPFNFASRNCTHTPCPSPPPPPPSSSSKFQTPPPYHSALAAAACLCLHSPRSFSNSFFFFPTS